MSDQSLKSDHEWDMDYVPVVHSFKDNHDIVKDAATSIMEHFKKESFELKKMPIISTLKLIKSNII